MIPDVGNELSAHELIRDVIGDAGERIAVVIEPATPSAAFLTELGEELTRAADDPSTAEYPELVDPDVYWDAAIKPQNKSVRRHVGSVLSYAESHISTHIVSAETELELQVRDRAAAAPPGDAASRAAVIDDIASHCQVLHHLVAELISVLPSREQLELARQALDEARRQRAVTDVEALKPMYLKEAGGDENHQRFAEQQWSETFADRVSHRDMMLRSEAPWRHQELAVVGHERTRDQIESMIDEAVIRLQEPLLEIGARLVRQYDSAAARSG